METESPKLFFVKSEKLINSIDKHRTFMGGKTYKKIIEFVSLLQGTVKSRINNSKKEDLEENSNIRTFMKLLAQARILIEENQPINKEKQRFGNVMFRTWYEKLEKYYDEELSSEINSMIKVPLIEGSLGLADELKPYFFECFGNNKRIDYGTGHELNFLMVLMICCSLNLFKEEEYYQLVQILFKEYFSVCKELQTVYNLEPAGSKGVYGLDDFHFISFIFGAAELIDNNDGINPIDMQKDLTILEQLAKKYMFFEALYYNLFSKKGHFAEHSPVLYQISNVQQWSKIAGGLIKMWEDELLKKYVVCQHLYFGSVILFE